LGSQGSGNTLPFPIEPLAAIDFMLGLTLLLLSMVYVEHTDIRARNQRLTNKGCVVAVVVVVVVVAVENCAQRLARGAHFVAVAVADAVVGRHGNILLVDVAVDVVVDFEVGTADSFIVLMEYDTNYSARS